MVNFLKFTKQSYCQIWGMEKNGGNLSVVGQLRFTTAMEQLELPIENLKEAFLITKLKQLAEESNLNIYYYLSSDKIYASTKFSYQISSSPRRDKVIIRT